VPVISSVSNVSGYRAPGGNTSRLLDGAGATLQALGNARNDVDRIKAALTKLRDALRAARDEAAAVPGRTALQPVVANVEQTQDKPTYVTIDGAVVQNGTITVSLGTRPLIAGYERVNRVPLAVGDALRSLVSTVATLVSTVGADGTGGLAADVSALLRSADFTTAVNRPDAAAIDSAIGRIDDTLAKAAGSRFFLSTRASSAAQVDLGGLLLGAAPHAGFDASGPAGRAGDSPYLSNTGSTTGGQVSSWA
jgi:hypothetical protein